MSADGQSFIEVFDSSDVSNAAAPLVGALARATHAAIFDRVDARYVRFASATAGYRIDEIEIYDGADSATPPQTVRLVDSSLYDPATGAVRNGHWYVPFVNDQNIATNATVTATSNG